MSLAITPTPFLATDGQNLGLFSMPSELTVAQAAKFLDMSEGCVNEFLDDEIIAFRLVNDERWVQRDSLLEFEADYREGREFMAEITQMAQEMGLYD